MTRVLFWNIQKISPDQMSSGDYGPTADKLDYILDVIDNNYEADIFVLLELATDYATAGEFCPNNVKGNAALKLLAELRAYRGNDWHLVPPISTGEGKKSEGVAVFYDNAEVKFTGPWKSIGNTTVKNPGRGQVEQAARAPYDTCLPATEQKLGGQWDYTDTAGKQIDFPDDQERRPWLVTFQERGRGGRNLEIIGFHAAYGDDRKQAIPSVKALQKVSEIYLDAVPNNTVRVLGGDFNVKATSKDETKAAYDPLTVTPVGGGGQKFSWVHGAKHYKTTLKRPDTAKPLPGKFPQYRYTSNSFDQIFTKTPPGTVSSDKSMIVNQVVGVDESFYANSGYPPQLNKTADTAKYSYPPGMTNSMYDIRNKKVVSVQRGKMIRKNMPDQDKIDLFQEGDNFGGIRTVSDHMGVIIEV